MMIAQTHAVDEDHVIWSKAPEQKQNGSWPFLQLESSFIVLAIIPIGKYGQYDKTAH